MLELGDGVLLPSLPIAMLPGHFSELDSPDWQYSLCFPHHLQGISPEAHFRRPFNLIWPKIFLAIDGLGWIPSVPFIFRMCPHYWFVCQACDFPWSPYHCFPSPGVQIVVRMGNLETLIKGLDTRFFKTFFYLLLFENKIIIKIFIIKVMSNRDVIARFESLCIA